MVKRFSLVLATLTLVIGCSYYLTGKVIQKNYYESVVQLNQHTNFKVNLLNYNRGLFTSEATLTAEIGADNPDDAQVFPLKQVITHGPVIAANTVDGPRIKILAGQIKTFIEEPLRTRLEEATTNKNPLTITTLVKFSKYATTWFRLDAADQSTPTQFHVSWDAVHGLIDHDFAFDYYHGFIAMPNLMINNPDWKFAIKNLTLNLDANKKESVYTSSNTMTTETITYARTEQELIKLNGISAILAFTTKDNNIGLDMEATVSDAHILEQHFQNDKIKLQADNLNRTTLAQFPRITTLGAKGTVDLLQQLTLSSSNVILEVPKHFTEALISYVSFELYRTSYLGKFDARPANAILQDITGSINKLVQGAVMQELFLDKGTHYALNFDRPAKG